MHRSRLILCGAVLAGMMAGCGEDQPNAPAQPSEVTGQFAQKTVDMMKSANTGMDPKAARKTGGAPAPK
jgi:hypothetical protein